MRNIIKYSMCIALGAMILSGPAMADDHGTKAEAEALVKKTIEVIKTDGTEKTFAAITAKDPKFIDRDLYPVAYDIEGNCIAHGANAKLVGKNLLDVQDSDGTYFVKERTEKAKTENHFWQDYKYVNPVSKKIEPKQAYCEKLEKAIICAGAYKQ